MVRLQEYSNGGFELNEPDYKFDDIYFVGTCGSHPEQYDCYIVDSEEKKLQAGYLRLRGGVFKVYFPDILTDDCELLLWHGMQDDTCGEFDDEEQRVSMLMLAAELIKARLNKE